MREKSKRVIVCVLMLAFFMGCIQNIAANKTAIAQEKQNVNQAKESKKEEPVELPEERTNHSTTYQEKDGKKITEFYGDEVRFRDKKTEELKD